MQGVWCSTLTPGRTVEANQMMPLPPKRSRSRRQEIQLDTLQYVKKETSGLSAKETKEWLERQIAFLSQADTHES